LVAMNTFCISFIDTDLASLHYITSIEPFVVSPKEALSFGIEEFMNTSTNKLIEPKDRHFPDLRRTLLRKHFGV
jgi:hypothetical protein